MPDGLAQDHFCYLCGVMAQFVSRLPDPRLRPYVKVYFWGYDSHAPRVQRIVPNGEMGLCFYRSNPVIYDGVGRVNSCLAGQNIHYQDIISIDGKIEIRVENDNDIAQLAYSWNGKKEYKGYPGKISIVYKKA